MKLKDLIEQYGDYEVIETKGDWYDAGHVTLELNKPQKTVWGLEKGDEYFYHYGNCVYRAYWGNSEHYDQSRTFVGNVFLSEEEAKNDLERRNVETLLLKHGGRRWFKKGGGNWFLYLDDYNIVSRSCTKAPYQGMIYFDTHGEAVDACEKIGSSQIKKALFEVR